jgi:hypothetical protein
LSACQQDIEAREALGASVEKPAKVEFLINFKTSKALEVTIPPILHARATR